MAYTPSIFNDVLGPVMTGPSSSHTAGPGRIGLLARCLLPDFNRATIAFPKDSSYAGTYEGQKSHIAFTAGLLGMDIAHPDFKHALDIAKCRGISVTFTLCQQQGRHPNTAFFTLENALGETATAETHSTGGGMVAIVDINGQPVELLGDSHALVWLWPEPPEAPVLATLQSFMSKMGVPAPALSATASFQHWRLHGEPSPQQREAIEQFANAHGAKAFVFPPVLPVATCTAHTEAPFTTAAALLEVCDSTTQPMALWEAAVMYESTRSSWSAGQVLDYGEHLLAVMEQSVNRGLAGEFTPGGFSNPQAKGLLESTHPVLDLGVMHRASAYATAVMAYNSAMGTVVAAPTAGSCGVLPAVVLSVLHDKHLPRQEGVRALLCAGLVGVFIAEQATFAAETGGCQAEVGSAAAMAAAAVAHFSGCPIRTCLKAAAMAMSNMLGLICDPVAGCVDVPCISRNAAGAANAFVSAHLAAAGLDPVIPLDEVIVAMGQVGAQLPPQLRCTGLGGLCTTPTGQRMLKTFQSANNT